MRFMVVSYFDEEKQTFWDVVEADDEDSALALAAQVRGEYAVICDAVPVAELRDMAGICESLPYADLICAATVDVMKERYA